MDADLVHAFRTLLAREPELRRSVRSLGDPREAAGRLAQIGALHGLPTSEAEIMCHVRRLAEPTGPEPLTDADLDGVVGGTAAGDRWLATFYKLLF